MLFGEIIMNDAMISTKNISANNMRNNVKIGLEIHVQLNTKTKLFCSCPVPKSGDVPNSKCCEICLGHPGSKPVLNREALKKALLLALALNCTISEEIIFSRKSYFYPDLAKNYQISQFEIPLGKNGYIQINGKKINLRRVHIEEDPAALVHPETIATSSYVLIDYNRSGIPLCEIVTEPDIISPEEARLFMKKIITILDYLNIYDPNLVIKADANVSIKESGYVRAEIKNISSFKEIERALNYEIQRHRDEIKEGKKIIQETRAWRYDSGKTILLRKKETEEDYGYIVDPDLCTYHVSADMLKKLKDEIPEMPEERINKFVSKFKLAKDDAEVIANEKVLAEMLERAAEKVKPELAARWIRREVVRIANYHDMDLHKIPLTIEQLVELLDMVEKNKITDNTAKEILERLFERSFSPAEYVKENNLGIIHDLGRLKDACRETVDDNKKVVEDYLSGKEEALNFLLGQVMKKTKGKANPKEIREMMLRLIKDNN